MDLFLECDEEAKMKTSCPAVQKHCKNRKKLHRKDLIGCWGVKLPLLKAFTSTTVTTATVTIVTITTVTIWVFDFCHNLIFLFCPNLSFWVLSLLEFFFNFVTIWFFEFGHNLIIWVLSIFEFLILSQSEFLSFVKIIFV